MNRNIKPYKLFEEKSPRIPRLTKRGLNYWKNKGKRGRDVMVYTHDDMDGIFSAIVVKSRLLELGYNIIGYGLLNYMDSWKNINLNPEIINVAVDFAEMPNNEYKDLIDIYIDHHGEYSEDEKEHYKENPIIKTKTGSAYEGICNVLGKQTDEILLYSIDMIDSAKYDDYNVDWEDILNFSWKRFIEIAKKPGKVTIKPFTDSKPVTFTWAIVAKLTFAGAFNQFLKRSDHKTIIEVIENVKEPSIYAIYIAMKRLYPGNNVWKTGGEKDFVSDGKWRIKTMKNKTRGTSGKKKVYNNQKDFIDDNGVNKKGYQIIGNLMYVPSGVWANALRARSILITDIKNGIVPENQVDFIMLQYGNTIQICSVDKMETIQNKPIIKGNEINDLSEYMFNLLKNFKMFFGYKGKNTEVDEEEVTITGGHIGIGTISNIIGKIRYDEANDNKNDISNKLMKKYDGYNYLDLFKNKIISDLSNLGNKWPIGMKWSDVNENNKSKIISDIINNHKLYVKKIEDYKKEHGKFSDKLIEKRLKKHLNELPGDELKKLHNEAMMDNKVVMKDDIRKINNTGGIKENKITKFKNF